LEITYNVTGYQFAGLDFDFCAVSDNRGSHGDVALQTGDHVCGLFFLVPTDSGVEQQNTDNHTEINPVTQTSREEDSNFHN
jgi:hypothetical protein